MSVKKRNSEVCESTGETLPCSWTSCCSPNATRCVCSVTASPIEIEKAKRKGQFIRWFTNDCKEVSNYGIG